MTWNTNPEKRIIPARGGGVSYPWLLNNIDPAVEKLPLLRDETGQEYFVVPDALPDDTNNNRFFAGYLTISVIVSKNTIVFAETLENKASGSRCYPVITAMSSDTYRLDNYGLVAAYYINSSIMLKFKGTLTEGSNVVHLDGYFVPSLYPENDLTVMYNLSRLLSDSFVIVDNRITCAHANLSFADWVDTYYESVNYSTYEYRQAATVPWIFTRTSPIIIVDHISASTGGTFTDDTFLLDDTFLPIDKVCTPITSCSLLCECTSSPNRPDRGFLLSITGIRINGINNILLCNPVPYFKSGQVSFIIYDMSTDYTHYLNVTEDMLM